MVVTLTSTAPPGHALEPDTNDSRGRETDRMEQELVTAFDARPANVSVVVPRAVATNAPLVVVCAALIGRGVRQRVGR